jgi:hypothetical protein
LEVDPEAVVEGRRCLERFDREWRGMDGEQGGNAVWKRRVGDTVRGRKTEGEGGRRRLVAVSGKWKWRQGDWLCGTAVVGWLEASGVGQ